MYIYIYPSIYLYRIGYALESLGALKTKRQSDDSGIVTRRAFDLLANSTDIYVNRFDWTSLTLCWGEPLLDFVPLAVES